MDEDTIETIKAILLYGGFAILAIAGFGTLVYSFYYSILHLAQSTTEGGILGWLIASTVLGTILYRLALIIMHRLE